MVVFSGTVKTLLGGFSEQTWLVIGIVLMLWSADLVITASVPKLIQRFAQLTVYADWALVVFTQLILALLIAGFTMPGIAAMIATAAIAAAFAWNKQKNIGNSRDNLPLAN